MAAHRASAGPRSACGSWRRTNTAIAPEPGCTPATAASASSAKARITLCDPAATGQLSETTLAWVRQAEAALPSDAARALVAVDLVENATGTERACHLHVRAGVVPGTFEPLAAGLTGLSLGSEAAGVDEERRRIGRPIAVWRARAPSSWLATHR